MFWIPFSRDSNLVNCSSLLLFPRCKTLPKSADVLVKNSGLQYLLPFKDDICDGDSFIFGGLPDAAITSDLASSDANTSARLVSADLPIEVVSSDESACLIGVMRRVHSKSLSRHGKDAVRCFECGVNAASFASDEAYAT